ncbi:DUF4007 family protein [Aquimarina muelleri]|uniref:DUF4007 domain-containing protein n=1 Tax=Aquimarina muelleri TaxID=279356 RepID=A0A918N362_9FLAO|nr:DUF4007 family protein [Aquimarina muelleri]MCX2764603.1 DUF4007 family protein [Aquimarina muelleri]GGX19310.1 hypothetical protein GCM10007384_20830 [Aquimarina muelleri]
MKKLRFTGHETFHCRHFWLKKGFDFTIQNNTISDQDAVVKLGVGKNMVASIDFWLKAFHIKNEQDETTSFAQFIFNDVNGLDPFLEYEGTLWLLHYQLLKTEIASIYPLVFKDFRKQKINSQFTSQQLLKYLQKEERLRSGSNTSENSLKTDIKVFLRTYFLDKRGGKDLEDDLSSIFIDLNLIDKIDNGSSEGLYQLKVTEREEIPVEIFLYAILDTFKGEVSIPFDAIQEKIGDIFACNAEGLELKIAEICDRYKFAVYKEDGGRKQLQIKGEQNKLNILENYYNAQVYNIN